MSNDNPLSLYKNDKGMSSDKEMSNDSPLSLKENDKGVSSDIPLSASKYFTTFITTFIYYSYCNYISIYYYYSLFMCRHLLREFSKQSL